jgi:hypothetical protein
MNDPFSGVNQNELMNTFNRVSQMFNPRPLRQAYGSLIGNTLSTGQQLANNAGGEYLNRAQQSGGSSLGAGVAQAQAYLPFLNQVSQLQTQKAKDVMGAKEAGISLQAQIAAQLANLRQSYASSLAQFQTQQRGQDIQLGEFNRTQGFNEFQANRQWNNPFHGQVSTTNYSWANPIAASPISPGFLRG